MRTLYIARPGLQVVADGAQELKAPVIDAPPRGGPRALRALPVLLNVVKGQVLTLATTGAGRPVQANYHMPDETRPRLL
jgi:hypothetical protein